MNQLKIALVSCSQLSFPGNKKAAFAVSCEGLAKLAGEWGFTLYVYPRGVITADDGYTAVKALEEEKVDFILLQCTSFSAGHLAPIFARVKNTALGLWAIPEGVSGGCVPFNSLCGIHMYSAIIGHYLDRDQIPIKWFYGQPDDGQFLFRLQITVRALSAIKRMRSASVALIGGIAPGFDDLYDDERRLIKVFDGLRVNRLHEYAEIRDLAVAMDKSAVEARMTEERSAAAGVHTKAESLLETNARFVLAYEKFLETNGYDAIAVSCWPKFQDEFQYSVCAVVGELNDRGVPVACEGDLTSAVSMLLLKYLAEDTVTLMDLSAFDKVDDSVLLWHCGPTGTRFCGKDGYTLGLNYSGMAQDERSPEPTGCGVVRDMVFGAGEVTMARLTGECDTMFLAGGQILEKQRESFYGSRGWVGNLTLNRKPISAQDFINTILVQRFQHHFPMVYGDYSREITEIMAWLKLSRVEAVPYEDFMQNPAAW